MPARTSPTLHPPPPPTVLPLSRLKVSSASIVVTSTLRVKPCEISKSIVPILPTDTHPVNQQERIHTTMTKSWMYTIWTTISLVFYITVLLNIKRLVQYTMLSWSSSAVSVLSLTYIPFQHSDIDRLSINTNRH